MSNFVVTNAQETQDAVNYLLTTKAPGVLIVDGQKKIDDYTVIVDFPANFTFYEATDLAVTITTQQPNQPVFVFGQAQVFYTWSGATIGDTFDFGISIFRFRLDVPVDNVTNPVPLIDFGYGPYSVPTTSGFVSQFVTWVGAADVAGIPGNYYYTLQTYYDVTNYPGNTLVMDQIGYQNATNLVTSSKT